MSHISVITSIWKICDRNNSRASKISWPNWRPSIQIQEVEIMSSSTPEIP